MKQTAELLSHRNILNNMSQFPLLRDKLIITLDTTIIRNLCYEDYCWVYDFEKMSKERYHFCLPDCALFEFINQFINKSIPLYNFQKGIKRFSIFISEDFPVLFGGNKIFQQSVFKTNNCNTTFDPNFYQAFSKAIWNFVSRVDDPSFFENEEMVLSVSQNEYKLNIDLINQIFQKARDEWIEFITGLTKNVSPHHKSNEKSDEISFIKEKMSEWMFRRNDYTERVDIISKFIYSFIQNAKSKNNNYNPKSKKNKNDGIDFNIVFFHLIPSIICSEDGFIKKFQNIDSYQCKWFYKPSELVEAWKKNKVIEPIFR